MLELLGIVTFAMITLLVPVIGPVLFSLVIGTHFDFSFFEGLGVFGILTFNQFLISLFFNKR